MKANQSRDQSLNIEKFYHVPWGLKRNKRQSEMNQLVRSCVDGPAMWKGFLTAFSALIPRGRNARGQATISKFEVVFVSICEPCLL